MMAIEADDDLSVEIDRAELTQEYNALRSGLNTMTELLYVVDGDMFVGRGEAAKRELRGLADSVSQGILNILLEKFPAGYMRMTAFLTKIYS